MPSRCAALLIALACLVAAAPAAASERSEARAYIAALQVDLAPTPADYAAWLADYRFRAHYVAATCLDAAEEGARRHDRSSLLLLTYFMYAADALQGSRIAWSEAVDQRLAAIPTRSRVLRRGRLARRHDTAERRAVVAATPEDFCGEVRDWQAAGWKGRSPMQQRLRAAPPRQPGRGGGGAPPRAACRAGAGAPRDAEPPAQRVPWLPA